MTGLPPEYGFEPGEPASVPPEPVEPEPFVAEPFATEPVEPQPVAREPFEPTPVEPEPFVPEPVEPQPVTPEPFEPQSVEPPVAADPVEEEEDVLRSWADRLEALHAPEPAPEPAPLPVPAYEPATEPTVELPAPPVPAQPAVAASPPSARPRVKPRRRGQKHRRVVGLKIGATQLAAATVTNNGSAEVVQLAREPLAHGIVVAGEVREPVELAAALKAFFKKHKLPKKDVRLGVAANRIGVRTFDLPDVTDPRQLENAILFRAQEVLPVPVHEAVLDYHILDGEQGERSRVLLVVAYRELIDAFLEACDLADLKLAGIDLEAFALLRTLGAPLESGQTPQAARVAVSVGHHRSTVAVTDGRVCDFTRVIDWGGDKLDVAIARALGVTPQEAAPIKHELSLTEPPATEAGQAALDAVLRELHAFTRDLVSSLHFYQSQPDALEIAEIALTGGTARLAGMPEELQRLIGVRVRLADPLARVRLGKKLEQGRDDAAALAVAIGLGIED